MILRVKRLHPKAVLPRYAHAGDAALDLCALHNDCVYSNEHAYIRTGIAIALPRNTFGFIVGRSGLAKKQCIGVHPQPVWMPHDYGTIDEPYRGELGIILINHGRDRFEFSAGDRLAQLLVLPVHHVTVEEVAELDATARGTDGFGSTGA